jgi:Rrf2 family protein
MIKISKQTDYAFQLILELSKLDKNAILSLKKFSIKSNISFLFLQKIAKSLREAGIIKSIKGQGGGYMLNKDIEKISIKEVIEAVDGSCGMVECVKEDSCCGKKDCCSIKDGMSKISTQMEKILENTSVASIIK